MIQQLFPQDNDQPEPRKDAGYLMHNRHGRKIEPVSQELIAPHTAPHPAHTPHVIQPGQAADNNAAIELIRRKVAAVYAEEPDLQAAADQTPETAATVPAATVSRHQQYMHDLTNSGKSLAQIQTEWHNYYVSLPDDEKHLVWQEFYAANARQPSSYTQHVVAQQPTTPTAVPPQTAVPSQNPLQPNMRLPSLPGSKHGSVATTTNTAHPAAHRPQAVVAEHSTPAAHDRRTAAGIRKQLLGKVRSNSAAASKAKQHFQSLLFGLSTGVIVLVIFLFGFFNEMIIAPFIQPSRTVSATPIIVSSDSVAASATPEVIIPKINVQIPVVYDEPSMEEAAIQNALERGVVHYPTTVNPGEQGNAAIFGHSSNNIFNKGKYKFAFVLLRHLVPGDIFYLTYNNTVYSYRVFDKKVVTPQEVSVLNPVAGKTATAALITCDPPGTSTNRLVVWGEQISPDPSGAPAPTTVDTSGQTAPEKLPSEGQSLWSRIWGWL